MPSRRPRVSALDQVIGWQLRSKSIPSELATGDKPNYIQIKHEIESRLLSAIAQDQAEQSRDTLIVYMYMDGYSGPEIARRFSLSTSQIYRLIKKEGKRVLKNVLITNSNAKRG